MTRTTLSTTIAKFKFQNYWVSSCERVSTSLPLERKSAGLSTLVRLTTDTSLEPNAASQCLSVLLKSKSGNDSNSSLRSMQVLARQFECSGFTSSASNFPKPQSLRKTDAPGLHCPAAHFPFSTISIWPLSSMVPALRLKPRTSGCLVGSKPSVGLP